MTISGSTPLQSVTDPETGNVLAIDEMADGCGCVYILGGCGVHSNSRASVNSIDDAADRLERLLQLIDLRIQER